MAAECSRKDVEYVVGQCMRYVMQEPAREIVHAQLLQNIFSKREYSALTRSRLLRLMAAAGLRRTAAFCAPQHKDALMKTWPVVLQSADDPSSSEQALLQSHQREPACLPDAFGEFSGQHPSAAVRFATDTPITTLRSNWHAARAEEYCPPTYMPACDWYRGLYRDILHWGEISPSVRTWNDGTVAKLADGIYQDEAFDRLPILADALEDAGCDNADILKHCRSSGPHLRGCWAVDLILEKRKEK